MHSELPGYAELHCLSAFSFQRGASIAEELFARRGLLPRVGDHRRMLAGWHRARLAGSEDTWRGTDRRR